MAVTRLQTVRHSRAGKPRTEADIKSALLLADAALGAAGHEVTDPQTRSLARSVAAGGLAGDEAIRRLEAIERAQ